MERWVTIFLVIYLLEFSLGTATWCGDAYRSATRAFYNKKTRYTCIDMQYIQHGKGCYRKCDSITRYYNLFGYRQCTQGTCPVRYGSSAWYRHPDQCDREAEPGECDSMCRYRSIDGRCNNLRYPDWGKSEIDQRRLLPNAYDDGFGSPRTHGAHGTLLPSAREVSNCMHKAGPSMKTEKKLTYMTMLFGQILAHDLVLSKLRTNEEGEPLMCCEEDKDDPACNPITIPMDDPHFEPGSCMDFARTNAAFDCNGILQQINSQTSFIDASMVYGRNLEESDSLRTFESGKVASIDNKLPADPADETCELTQPMDIPHYYCGRSGDPRVHENPALASIHTILMREHNRLADELAWINPNWDDETLFQEARKIVIAVLQNIIYREYLPILINPYWRRKYGLNIKSSGHKDTYDPHVDASITNAFAAAAFRMGHSQIHKHISMMGHAHEHMMDPANLEDNFFKAGMYHEGLEHVLMWTSATKCPLLDTELEESVQKLLFKDEAQLSFDLAALNIHRGRDHGLPGYNAYRKLCGLSNVKRFGTSHGGLVDHDGHIADMLRKTYDCPEDIDLFTGIISERREKGSILGPTGQCMLAIQFKRLRDGDRFFYDRCDSKHPGIGFNRAQLKEIKKVRLSTLFCLNMDATQLQKNLFKMPTDHHRHGHVCNRMTPCFKLREDQVDLRKWKDYNHV